MSSDTRFPTTRADSLPRGHCGCEVEAPENILFKRGRKRAPVGKRELRQIAAALRAERDGLADDFVRAAEWHAAVHEVVGDIGREQHRIGDGGGARGGIHLCVVEHPGEDGERGFHRVHAVEDRLLVLLHVAIVGHRQALQRREQRDEIADDAARFSAREFGDVGIFFLRHER